MKRSQGVHQAHLVLLLTAVVRCVQLQDRAVTLSNERSSIERTYELTKYLDHQLKEIKDTYLSYLGPPFSDPGFSPPRPNVSSLAVPSAATRVDLWRGLENGARLAQNQRAYSVLLSAVRELARSTLCPYLQSSLLHFCSGLSGLLGSISGLMNALGYTPPLNVNAQKYGLQLSSQQQKPGLNLPVPLRTNPARTHPDQAPGGPREGVVSGAEPERKRDRGRRGRRREGWMEREDDEKEKEREEGLERWGRRRKLLSVEEDENGGTGHSSNVNITHTSYFSQGKLINFNTTGALKEREKSEEEEEEDDDRVPLLFSSPSLRSIRSGRALPLSSTLSPLSIIYSDAEIHGSADLGRPALNDFTRKVEGFWVLRELQSWLWRSAKDFTRLKKRLRV